MTKNGANGPDINLSHASISAPAHPTSRFGPLWKAAILVPGPEWMRSTLPFAQVLDLKITSGIVLDDRHRRGSI
jgi:hypothetical protein